MCENVLQDCKYCTLKSGKNANQNLGLMFTFIILLQQNYNI